MNEFLESLNSDKNNYVLPFMWIRDGETDRLIEHIETIHNTGCNAICVESRPHSYFCEDEWWKDFEIILKECQKRNIDVWLLDDKQFPSGYAVGSIENHQECKQLVLIERHTDVIGPVNNHSLYIRINPDERLLGAFAYKYSEPGEVTDEFINLNDCIDDDRVYLQLSEGVWRICYYIVTDKHTNSRFINMVDSRSTDLMIQAVYEPHYEHFKEYFGNTFKGFFSDEANLGNEYFEWAKSNGDIYDKRIGNEGLALPYSDELLDRLFKTYGKNVLADAYGLWHTYGDKSKAIRLAYMNCVTELYSENFSYKLGDWCRAHGVEYIGHLIEDNGAHTRLGHGAGNYFRGIRGQDMAGIDVVLHQILPGFAHINNAIPCGYAANSTFFHYGLGKLASSAAHTTPHMKDRAICEIFGAYGWGESVSMMKWLCDFMLVRGINHFVPHAFSLKYPDPDSPPHFGVPAFPQKKGYKKLMEYLQNMCSILSKGTHICDAAILYHAEAEWMNYNCMPFETVAKELYDHQLDYDILDWDILKSCKVENGEIIIKEKYPCLIVPEASHLPEYIISKLADLESQGANIIYVNSSPENAKGKVVDLECISDYIGNGHLKIKSNCEFLRFFHKKGENDETVMFFNESVTNVCDFSFFAGNNNVTKIDLLHKKCYSVKTENGWLKQSLEPYESAVYILGNSSYGEEEIFANNSIKLNSEWNISLFDTEEEKCVAEYKTVNKMFDLTGKDGIKNFSGNASYYTEFNWDKQIKDVALKVYADNQTVECILNGKNLGIEICNPYTFDITNALQSGKNELTLIVSNTLGNKISDSLGTFFSLSPSGLTDNPEILY